MSTVEADLASYLHKLPATAADIESLIHLVQTKVCEQTTINLMHEVHIIGDY